MSCWFSDLSYDVVIWASDRVREMPCFELISACLSLGITLHRPVGGRPVWSLSQSVSPVFSNISNTISYCSFLYVIIFRERVLQKVSYSIFQFACLRNQSDRCVPVLEALSIIFNCVVAVWGSSILKLLLLPLTSCLHYWWFALKIEEQKFSNVLTRSRHVLVIFNAESETLWSSRDCVFASVQDLNLFLSHSLTFPSSPSLVFLSFCQPFRLIWNTQTRADDHLP